MGGAFRPFLGIINGYYELDLKHEMDRIALSRLLEQSQNDTVRRMAGSPLQPGQVGHSVIDAKAVGRFMPPVFRGAKAGTLPDLARQLGVPVVPVAVTGMSDVLRTGEHLFRPRQQVTVHVLAPIPTAGLKRGDVDALAESCRARIAERVDAWLDRERS